MRYRSTLCQLLLGVVVGLHAGASFAGAMVFFEPGPRLGPHQACVAPTVKAGDTLENVDGDRLVVHSISGKFASNFSPCAAADHPLLAEVELVESSDFRSAFTLDLPTTFAQIPPSDFERFELCRIRAYSSHQHIWLAAHSWDRRKVAEIDAFAAEQKRAQSLAGDITQTPTESLTIQGIPALRWETEHKPHSIEPNTSTVSTVLIGDSEVVVLTVTGITWKIGKYRDEMARMAEGAHGLTKEVRGSSSGR
jgi:hypothetical protein